MFTQSTQTKKDISFQFTECTWDWIYVATDDWNKYFVANEYERNLMMAFCHYLLDGFMIYLMYAFLIHDIKTVRVIVALPMFYILRVQVQEWFWFHRPIGYCYFDSKPWISMSVPYHDVNDFFFSGHMGGTTCLGMELYALGYKKMSYLAFVNALI